MGVGMAAREERLSHMIQRVPGFEHLNHNLLRVLVKKIKLESVEREMCVVSHGQPSSALYVLFEGSVSVHNTPRNRRCRSHSNACRSLGLGACTRIRIPGEAM